MELDGLQVPDLFVSNAHDGPIIGPGSHLQVLWTGGLLHNQTVITCRHEWTGHQSHQVEIPWLEVQFYLGRPLRSPSST